MNNNPELVNRIRSHLVLLYNSKTGQNGSGVLIEFQNKIFILTAAHVPDDKMRINFGYPWQYSNPEILNFWRNAELDVSFIELNPFQLNLLSRPEQKAYNIVRRQHVEVKLNTNCFAICGYPHEKKVVENDVTGFIPAFFFCTILHPELWPSGLTEKNKHPELHLAVPYGPKHKGSYYDSEKKILLQIKPGGMSGAGIWCFPPEDKNAEKPLYSLVALQTSYLKQSQVLVGTFITPIIEEIKKQYAD